MLNIDELIIIYIILIIKLINGIYVSYRVTQLLIGSYLILLFFDLFSIIQVNEYCRISIINRPANTNCLGPIITYLFSTWVKVHKILFY